MNFKDIIEEIIKEDSEDMSGEFSVPGYPDLPTENSPKEVVKFLKRFVEENSEEEVKNSILLYELLGSGTPEYKMSQDASEYTDQSSGEQKCSNCEFLYKKVTREDTYICSQIRGEVEPEGWCNQWKEAEGDEV